MNTVRLKNILNRPRVFSTVNSEGMVDAIRFRAGASLEIDVRLLTHEIIDNIKMSYLLLLEGSLPLELNPYLEKRAEKPKKINEPKLYDGENLPIMSEENNESSKKVFKKGAKN